MKNQPVYITDILEAIEKIQALSDGIDFDVFMKEVSIHDAIMYNFIVIGEASNRLTNEFKNQNSSVEWYKLKGMRNHLAHSYDEINYELVWETIKDDLPNLKSQIRIIINKYK